MYKYMSSSTDKEMMVRIGMEQTVQHEMDRLSRSRLSKFEMLRKCLHEDMDSEMKSEIHRQLMNIAMSEDAPRETVREQIFGSKEDAVSVTSGSVFGSVVSNRSDARASPGTPISATPSGKQRQTVSSVEPASSEESQLG